MGFTITESISTGYKTSYSNLYVNLCKGLYIVLNPAIEAKEATEFEPAIEAQPESLVCKYKLQIYEQKGGKQLASVDKDFVLNNGILNIAEIYSTMKADFITTVDC